jgi:hypothetical protein
MSDLPRMIDDQEANEVCAGFYRRGTLDNPNIYITGFLIAADEADQEISWLLAEGEK